MKRHIHIIRSAALTLPLLAAGALWSCSEHGEAPIESPMPHSGPILFGHSCGQVEWIDAQGITRDATTDTDIEAETPDDIGVFAFGDGQNTTYIFKNQRAYYKHGADFNPNSEPLFAWNYKEFKTEGNVVTTTLTDNLWPYTTDEASVVPRYWDKMNYRFFAYSPWCDSKDVKVMGESYSGFNQFTWDNIPGFSDKDYVLANEIVEVDNTGSTQHTPDAVRFSMRHILSRIRFFFKMSTEYRKYRKIQLNSITIVSAGKVKTATFNFKNNSWDEIVHWSNEQIGDAEPVTLFNKTTANYLIPTTYPVDADGRLEPFTSVYVYPQTDFNRIRMLVDYSVYDSEGIKTRDGKLNNIVTLPNWILKAGYYYDVKINIVPDYLYVLAESDHDYDSYIILQEE